MGNTGRQIASAKIFSPSWVINDRIVDGSFLGLRGAGARFTRIQTLQGWFIKSDPSRVTDGNISAWNAVLKGSKYWIMFPTSPSQPPPPGVFVSEDQSEVTSPLSIVEWLIGFHAEARRTSGCMEGVCNEGEVLHVPSGWWHLVVNLEPSIAITQNFVPEAHLTNVLAFLKYKSDQVSGFKSDIKNAYELFVQKMEASYPSLLDEALGQMEKLNEGKKRKWDELVNGDKDINANAGGFSFGFDDGDEEDIP